MQKEYEQVKSYFIKAKEQIDSGNIESALEYVTKLEESEDETLANFYLAPLYIDVGATNEDKTMVSDDVWYSKCNKYKITLRNLNFDNDGLSALLDINEDLRWGKENELTEPRHALTHRFLKVKLFSMDEDGTDERELYEKTLRLAKIVRNAIIYLMRLVDHEKSKKHSDAVLEVPLC